MATAGATPPAAAARDYELLPGEAGPAPTSSATRVGAWARAHRRALLVTAAAAALVGGSAGAFAGLVPLVAQRQLDAAPFSLTSLVLADASPLPSGDSGGGWSLALTAAGAVGLTPPVTLAMQPASCELWHNGSRVLTFAAGGAMLPGGVPSPALTLAGRAVVDAGDLPAFEAMARAAFAAPTVTVTVRAALDVVALLPGGGTWHLSLSLDKTVTLPGAAGTGSATVSNFSLAASNASCAVLSACLAVANPSLVSIQPLGDVGLDLAYGGAPVGAVTAANFSLLPGNATQLCLTSAITPPRGGGGGAAAAAAAASALVSAYLSGSPVTLTGAGAAVGNSTPLYAPLLPAINVTATLPGAAGASLGGLVLGVAIHGMALAPPAAGDNPAVLAVPAMNATITLANVAGWAALLGGGGGSGGGSGGGLLTNVSLHADVYVNVVRRDGGGPAGVDRPLLLGTLTVVNATARVSAPPPSPPAGAPPPPSVEARLDAPAVLTLRDPSGSSPAFAAFLAAFLGNATVTLRLGSPAAAALTAVMPASPLGRLILAVPLAPPVDVPIGGMDGLPGTVVTNFTVATVTDAAAADGSRSSSPLPASSSSYPRLVATLTADVHNPSPAALSLGPSYAAEVDIYVGGARIGAATLPALTLPAGNSSLALAGTIAPADAPGRSALALLISAYLRGDATTVTAVGVNVTAAAGDAAPIQPPPWLVRAVASLRLNATLPGAPPAARAAYVGQLNATAVTVDFRPCVPPVAAASHAAAPRAARADSRLRTTAGEAPNASAAAACSPLFSGNLTAVLALPFDVGLMLYSVNMTATLLSDSSAPLASFSVSQQAVQYTPCTTTTTSPSDDDPCGDSPAPFPGGARGLLAVALAPTPLSVLDAGAFTAFMHAVMATPSVELTLAGTVSADAALAGVSGGRMPLSGIPFTAVLTLPGLDGFTRSPPVVRSVGITHASPGGIGLSVALTLPNPTRMAAHLGPVTLHLTYGGYDITAATLPSLDVVPGDNAIVAGATFMMPADPAAAAAAEAFMSAYVAGAPSNVTLVGRASDASPIPLLAPALGAMTLADVTVPGLDVSLVHNGSLTVDVPAFVADPATGVNVSLTVANPLPAPLQLLAAACTVFMCKQPSPNGTACLSSPSYGDPIAFFADYDLSRAQPPLVLAANATTTTAQYPVLFTASVADMLAVFAQIVASGGVSYLNKVNGSALVSVGGFPLRLWLQVDNTPVRFNLAW